MDECPDPWAHMPDCVETDHDRRGDCDGDLHHVVMLPHRTAGGGEVKPSGVRVRVPTDRRRTRRLEEAPVPKPCPDCGEFGGLTLCPVSTTRPVGTWSLAGVQVKVSVRQQMQLACSRCGRSRLGRLEGVEVDAAGVVTAGHFVEEGGES